MQYAVTAQAFERESLRQAGASRTEVIDTVTNLLFKGCNTIEQVKDAYEAFWNELNCFSRDVVLVSMVTPRQRPNLRLVK